jgi:hypothetical protein
MGDANIASATSTCCIETASIGGTKPDYIERVCVGGGVIYVYVCKYILKVCGGVGGSYMYVCKYILKECGGVGITKNKLQTTPYYNSAMQMINKYIYLPCQLGSPRINLSNNQLASCKAWHNLFGSLVQGNQT